MLLAVDIGNSSIKFGIFDDDRLASKFLIQTRKDYDPEEIAASVGDRIQTRVDSAIACSVVPEIDKALAEYLKIFVHVEPRFVSTNDDFNLTFNFPINSSGTDRLVNSFAAAEKYGVPVVVVSFGTATTVDVINPKREHIGGLIAPGMGVSIKALELAASKLPDVEIAMPERVIAATTESSIQSGIFYGHVAMIEGLLRRVISELGDEPKVIATGGFAELIAPETDMIDLVDADLTLDGLRMLFQNHSPSPDMSAGI